MKKLLLIAVLALGAVACDRNELGEMDSMSINPIEATIEYNAQDRFNAFNDFLRGATFEAPKGEVSTNKGGDNGSDWIELIWFQHTSDNYVYTRPEQLGVACYDNVSTGVSNILHETYSYRASTQKVHIEAEGTVGEEFDIPSDLQPLYESAFADENSAIYFADNASNTYSFREGALPTVTVND